MSARITLIVTDDEMHNIKYRALLQRSKVSDLVRPRLSDLLEPVDSSEGKKEGAAQ